MTFSSVNPATGEIVWAGEAATAADVDAAVAKARDAFHHWSRRTFAERETHLRAFARELESRQAELAEAICLEVGEPRWEALTEVRSRRVIGALRRTYSTLNRGDELNVIQVANRDVPLAEAVRSYVFNSQVVTLGSENMVLVAPVECQETPSVQRFLEQLVASGTTPIKAVHYLNLRQSMRNGGGPACLRLRVVLTPSEVEAMAPRVRFTSKLHAELVAWVTRHYRDKLREADLADPDLLEESQRALDELTQLLELGSIYPFQDELSLAIRR